MYILKLSISSCIVRIADQFLAIKMPGSDLYAQILRDEMTLLMEIFTFAGLVLSLIILAFGTFATHRIVGPLLRLKNTMDDANATGVAKEVHFRKFDMFQDLADSFNSMIKKLASKNEK